jgi:hypothetical protein
VTDGLTLARPRLVRGLAVIRTRNGLLIDGALRRYRFTGAAAATALPKLLDVLDGQHDIAALSAETGLPQAELLSMLSVLGSRGLLETDPAATLAAPAAHVTDYLSRAFRPRPDHPDGGDVAQLLAEATVLLSAPGALARSVAADLRETGVRTAEVDAGGSGLDAAALAGLPSSSRRVAVVFDQPGDPHALSRVASALRHYGIPWLRCAADAGWIEVGPLFYQDYPACLACFQRGRHEAGWGTSTAGQPGAENAANTLAGLVVQETLAWLIGLGRPAPPRVLTRVTLRTHAHERYLVTPYPDCPDCGCADEASPAAEPSVLAYEWQLEEPPTALASPRAFAGPSPRLNGNDRDRSGQRSPSESIRSAPYLPRYMLSDADLPDSATLTSPAAGAEEPAIAGVLTSLRSAIWPTDAEATDVELYLLTRGRMFGLPGSLYRYDAAAHAVITIRTDEVSIERCLDGSDLDPAGLSMAVVFVAVAQPAGLARENPSYRAALLRAGRAAAQFSATASRRRLEVAFASRWPEELTGLLELRPAQETVAAVAGIMLDGKDHFACP